MTTTLAPAHHRSYGGWLLLFLLLKMVGQYWLINPIYQLHRDEYLHLDLGNHLAWGYISLPPLTAWVAWLVQALGNAPFWVHFFPALFGALTLAVVWALVHELGGGLYAKVLAAVAVLLSALLRLNLLFQPNSFDILAWTAATYCLVRALRPGQARWLLGVGAVVGLGLLNKYNVAFWVAGLGPAVLLTATGRRLLRQPQLYAAAALALLLVLPNLLWQVRHDFPVVWHMHELQTTQLVNVDRAGFIKEQLLLFLNSLFILIAAVVGVWRYAPLKPYRLVVLGAFFTLVLFIYLRAKGYYAAGLYPPLLAFGAVYLEHVLQTGRRRYVRPVLVGVVVLLFLPLLRVAFPLQPPAVIQQNNARYEALGMLRWEDGKNHPLPQDFADMLGWREMAAKATQAYQLLPDSLRQHTLVLCDNYGQTGALNYYARHQLPLAVSFNADYVYWFPDTRQIRAVVRVSEDTLSRASAAHFAHVQQTGTVTEPLAREYGTRIYLLTGPDAAVLRQLQQAIEERQQAVRVE